MSQTRKKFLSLLLCLVLFFFYLPGRPVSAGASGTISFVLLSKYSSTVNIGDEFYIIALTSNGKLPTWKSSSSPVASVNTYGKVTAKKSGTVTITAKIKNAEASCKVTVNKTRVTLSQSSASIEHSQTLKLSAVTSNKTQVTWKSSKKSIATVDENGTVTGLKPGETDITATADQTSVTCKLKVKLPTVKLNKTTVTLYRGQKLQLSATVSSGINPTWKTNKKSVATVNSSGLITAVKHGIAAVTATVDGVSKSCEITVASPIINLSTDEISLKKGASATLSASVSSGNAPVWSSSNSNVASVNSSGKITALKKGTAYIYASEDGTKAKCVLRITE